MIGLAEEQVHMLGHRHVAYHHKVIALSHLLQYFKKQVAILALAEQSTALVTAGSDKVQVSGAVIAAAGWAFETATMETDRLYAPMNTASVSVVPTLRKPRSVGQPIP